jgi:hypothetical protein
MIPCAIHWRVWVQGRACFIHRSKIVPEYLGIRDYFRQKVCVGHDGDVDLVKFGFVTERSEQFLIGFGQSKEIFSAPIIRGELIIPIISVPQYTLATSYRILSIIFESRDDIRKVDLL